MGNNIIYLWNFPGGSAVKNPPASAGDVRLIPGLGRSSGGRNGNPVQYSCLGNPHGQRSLVGYSPWSWVRHDWAHTHTDTEFCQTCYKSIIPLPLQLNSSLLPRSNHIWIPPADFYETFSMSPSNIHTLCLFDFSILSIIYWFPPVTSTELIFFHTSSPLHSLYHILILMLPIQLYRTLDGWSVSTGLKQIILCFLLFFSVIFPPGVNHFLLYDFFPLTFNVSIFSLLASNASQSFRHICGLSLPEARAPTGSWPTPIRKDWLPRSGHHSDPVSPFTTLRSSSSSRLYDRADVLRLMSF